MRSVEYGPDDQPNARFRLATAAAWGVVAGVYAACGLFTVLITGPLLPDDLAIYVKAMADASAGVDPYQPFGIGASFVYPPTALVLLWPLHIFPPAILHYAWAVLSVVLYLLTMRLVWAMSMARHDGETAARPSDRRRGLAWPVAGVTAAVMYAPFLETTVVGQANVIVLIGLMLFLARERSVPRWIGEAGLAIAIGLKVTPVLLLAAPVARREWPTVLRVIVSFVALAAFSVGVYGTKPWRGFSNILPLLAAGDTSGSNQATSVLVVKFASAIATPAPIATALGVLIPAALVGWWLWTLARQAPGRSFATELFGVSLLTTASTIVWYHQLTLLVPAIVVLASSCARANGPGTADAAQTSRPPTRLLTSQSLVVLCGLALIQTDRIFEVLASAPPVAAALGSMTVTFAAWRYATDRS